MKFAPASVALGSILFCAGPLFAQAPAKSAPAKPAVATATPITPD